MPPRQGSAGKLQKKMVLRKFLWRPLHNSWQQLKVLTCNCMENGAGASAFRRKRRRRNLLKSIVDNSPHIWIRSGYVFRGLPNYNWELLTSLMRCGKSPDHACKVELPIARSFLR